MSFVATGPVSLEHDDDLLTVDPATKLPLLDLTEDEFFVSHPMFQNCGVPLQHLAIFFANTPSSSCSRVGCGTVVASTAHNEPTAGTAVEETARQPPAASPVVDDGGDHGEEMMDKTKQPQRGDGTTTDWPMIIVSPNAVYRHDGTQLLCVPLQCVEGIRSWRREEEHGRTSKNTVTLLPMRLHLVCPDAEKAELLESILRWLTGIADREENKAVTTVAPAGSAAQHRAVLAETAHVVVVKPRTSTPSASPTFTATTTSRCSDRGPRAGTSGGIVSYDGDSESERERDDLSVYTAVFPLMTKTDVRQRADAFEMRQQIEYLLTALHIEGNPQTRAELEQAVSTAMAAKELPAVSGVARNLHGPSSPLPSLSPLPFASSPGRRSGDDKKNWRGSPAKKIPALTVPGCCEGNFPATFCDYLAKFSGQEWYGPTLMERLAIGGSAAANLIFSAIGSFVGIAVCGVVSQYAWAAHSVKVDGLVPVGILGSMGAEAVLLYAAPQAPFSQPWAVIGGNLVGAITGTFCRSVFQSDQNNYMWLSAALAVSITITVQHVTKSLHPPGGATALIAVLAPAPLGWIYIATPVLIGYIIMLLVAIVINNITVTRSYPKWWI